MEVRKSDSTFEEYNPEKVKHGICEAYNSMNEICPDGLIESLIKNLFIYDKISSNEIRRQVEESLCEVKAKALFWAKIQFTKKRLLMNLDEYL